MTLVWKEPCFGGFQSQNRGPNNSFQVYRDAPTNRSLRGLTVFILITLWKTKIAMEIPILNMKYIDSNGGFPLPC